MQTCSSVLDAAMPTGHGVSLGSYEYLVYEKVFVAVAAEFGLQPVTDYASESAAGFRSQYHEHRPLSDLLEQVSCAVGTCAVALTKHLRLKNHHKVA